MTQGKHTPGPWAWVKNKSDWGGTWLFSDETPVLDYAGCGSHDTEIDEANARLIEAAPDMLEALREARRAIGDHHAPSDCYATGPLTGDHYRDLVECPACSFIAKYDAAIAKAEVTK